MNGLALSEKFYNEFGRAALTAAPHGLADRLCFALVGPGSECYGFDDELSQDHDFGPDFCVFYPDDAADSKAVFALERAYAKLPRSFEGFERPLIAPYGGAGRRGVIGIREFYLRYVPEELINFAAGGVEARSETGALGGTVAPGTEAPEAWYSVQPETLEPWYGVRSESLFEATDGRVFSDPYGEFSRIRAGLSKFPPDINKKHLSGRLFELSQCGEYNFPRALKRGDRATAALFLSDFVRLAAQCVYLLNDAYFPYQKWLLRGLEKYETPSGIGAELNRLVELAPEAQAASITTLSQRLAEAGAQKYGLGLAGVPEDNKLQAAAFGINDTIADNTLRNSDILFLLN